MGGCKIGIIEMSSLKDREKKGRKSLLNMRDKRRLEKDVVDLFSENVMGGCSEWFYSEPCFEGDKANGAEVASQYAAREAYYPRHNEAKILKKPDLQKHLRKRLLIGTLTD